MTSKPRNALLARIPACLLVATLVALPLGAEPTAAAADPCPITVEPLDLVVECGIPGFNDSCSFVSGASTQADGHDSVVLRGNQEWEVIPPGPGGTPRFIWASHESENPLQATFVQGSNGFCLGHGTLTINVDNDADAYWNGVLVWSCADTPTCFQDSFQVPVYFGLGVNTLVVHARNDCCWGSTYVNPAMLQFRVDGPTL